MGVTSPENHSILLLFLHFFQFLIFLIERVDHVGQDQSLPKRLAHWNFANVPAKSPKYHVCCRKKRKNFISKETSGHVSSVLLKSLPGARASLPVPNSKVLTPCWQVVYGSGRLVLNPQPYEEQCLIGDSITRLSRFMKPIWFYTKQTIK